MLDLIFPRQEQETKGQRARLYGVVTCCSVAFLIGVKVFASVQSGSDALFASLMDNVVDAIVSCLNFAALYYAARPADHDHRHGHGKIEGLSALVQGAVMVLAAAILVFDVLFHAEVSPLKVDFLSIFVMVVSIFVSLFITWWQGRGVQETGSLVLEADRAHYTVDVVQNLSVIAVLVAVYYGAPAWLDSVVALGVALWMFKASAGIFSAAVDMILDRELADEDRQKIIVAIVSHKQVLGVHDVRATRSGTVEKIYFDIEVDPDLPCWEAHQITKDIEVEILKDFPEAEVMIHVDPYGEIEDSRHKNRDVHH